MPAYKTMTITENQHSITRRVFRRLAATITVTMLLSFSLAVAEAKRYDLPHVNPNDFVSLIDNPYMPLESGTTFVYEAETKDEFILNNITVTDETKEIMGVSCTVVYDVEWVNDLLTEETYDWYAQDSSGNVWYFGEATTEYLYDETGVLIGTSTEGSWEAGVDGATPGIVMLATPKPGISYRQEFYEGVAEDMSKVLRLNAHVSVEYGDFAGCLKTKEWTPLKPGVIEHKYYAPGIGLVFVEEIKGKTVKVALVDVIK